MAVSAGGSPSGGSAESRGWHGPGGHGHGGHGHGQVVRVCALYPDLMNIYADRGNLLVLERRCTWRGIDFELAGSGIGEPLDGQAHDIYYIGGGQDRDQRLCAADLLAVKRDALWQAAQRGAIVLGICGGYQLLGRSYTLGDEQIEGVGLLDVQTVRGEGSSGTHRRPWRASRPSRLIGNVAIEVSPRSLPGRGGSAKRVLAGFENHGGRTHLGADVEPLGRVIKGHGNDGRSGWEGACSGTTIGTYMHGPLLPKNVWFADWLIATALGVATDELPALDDALERQAHLSACAAAGV
jgi:lipid II isoglutaminyl synthase (glutamine-hydrolysing)